VTSLTLFALVHASILAADSDSYTEAHREAERGKPMIVMVAADWCSPCQAMKKTVIPEVKKRGLLKQVAFAVVNVDRQRSLARRLIGGGPIPQLVMYRKTDDGWKRRKLVGRQSVKTVEKFIKEGVALAAKAEKEAEEEPSGQEIAGTPRIQPVSQR